MLGLLIVLKGNPTLKKNVYDKIFSENINFSKITDLYEKYLGSIFPLDIKDSDTQTVSSKKIDYTKSEAYKDGVSLNCFKKLCDWNFEKWNRDFCWRKGGLREYGGYFTSR